MMFKNLLGIKIIVFLVIAIMASVLIFKDFIFGKPMETYRYTLSKSWALPDSLKEISGMIHLDENRLICVQDEDGYLFIYNLKTSQIDQKIKFGGGGDYESITKVKDTIYVLRSDGKLFEIKDFLKNKKIETYTFEVNSKYNFEGLYYDSQGNRLLMSPKYKLKRKYDTKYIFSFDLAEKRFNEEPVYELKLKHPIFENHPEFMPASLTQHPATKNFYMLDGRHRRLLILDSTFKPLKIYKLNISELPQPESLSFYEDKIFISTEADRSILQHIYEITLEE